MNNKSLLLLGLATFGSWFLFLRRKPLVITTASPLPEAVNVGYYSTTLKATGGNGSYFWIMDLSPVGLSFRYDDVNHPSGDEITISGNPQWGGRTEFSFQVTVSDNEGEHRVTKTFVIPIVYIA